MAPAVAESPAPAVSGPVGRWLRELRGAGGPEAVEDDLLIPTPQFRISRRVAPGNVYRRTYQQEDVGPGDVRSDDPGSTGTVDELCDGGVKRVTELGDLRVVVGAQEGEVLLSDTVCSDPQELEEGRLLVRLPEQPIGNDGERLEVTPDDRGDQVLLRPEVTEDGGFRHACPRSDVSDRGINAALDELLFCSVQQQPTIARRIGAERAVRRGHEQKPTKLTGRSYSSTLANQADRSVKLDLPAVVTGGDDMDVSGATALVTGANRGLGRHFVLELLDRGAKVYATARRPELIDIPGAMVLQLDVTDEDSVTAAAAAAPDVDLLINNAAVTTGGSLVDGDLGSIRAAMDSSYYGSLSTIRAFAPTLSRNGGGAVLNVLSAVAWMTVEGNAAYAAAKSAQWALTNGVRLELAAQGTLVSALVPGLIDTSALRDFAREAGIPLPEDRLNDPRTLARRALDGIAAGDVEILDDSAADAKARLAGPPTHFDISTAGASPRA